MPLTKDELIAKLKDAGISFETFEHPPVMTVDAQISALPGNPKTVLKNLFIKDKKHRCYIITALPETKVDLQVVGARLGVGKGGIRMAPEELLTAVLQVPLGSVTPLAIANPEATNVVLLLDAKIRDAAHVPADGGRVYVHPLVNTTSLAMTPGALADAIKALGREPLFVDLEVDPKIDRDNPPDLKTVADAAQPPPQALPEAAAAGAAAAPAAGADGGAAAAAPAAKPAAPAAKESKKDAKKGGGKSADQQRGAKAATTASLTDVAPRVEELLRAACAALLGGSTTPEEATAAGRVDAYCMARLRADLEMQLTGLKNAAYAAGYVAGKGEVVAHAERRFV
ncbi:hypothetical protein PLESTB_000502400 [Pleodorina starrii]|uniref:YbaK/aminoacyl-tRNA synthetase-associated domain-containing protein n=1 Tax=Pleodorina starrii TaxID=330485 RepID=A0A9W6BG64_9CHLO|nr:hypothetical protein PLESTM_001774000 [Pleodorina starrii]GLC51438.1 hypothetical protein PLESTB_000502400 [Pleodorina starrii]GLC67744.1 hypothetical protein PLESTF_000601000 [Pleodorina starrii]